MPTCGEQFTANLGKARSEGGDVDILFKPVDALLFELTAAYVDAHLTRTSCAGAQSFNGAGCVGGGAVAAPVASSGDGLLGAPWSFTGSAEYRLAEHDRALPYIRADYQYQTAERRLLQGQDPRSALYDSTIPGLPVTHNLSLRAGVRFTGVDLSFFANNVTNSQPLLFESRDIAAPSDLLYYGRGVRPRTVGLTATYRY